MEVDGRTGRGRRVEVRSFYRVSMEERKPGGSSFADREEVAADRGLAEQVVAQARAELLAWRRRYNTYRCFPCFEGEFGGVLHEIEKVENGKSE